MLPVGRPWFKLNRHDLGDDMTKRCETSGCRKTDAGRLLTWGVVAMQPCVLTSAMSRADGLGSARGIDGARHADLIQSGIGKVTNLQDGAAAGGGWQVTDMQGCGGHMG